MRTGFKARAGSLGPRGKKDTDIYILLVMQQVNAGLGVISCGPPCKRQTGFCYDVKRDHSKLFFQETELSGSVLSPEEHP